MSRVSVCVLSALAVVAASAQSSQGQAKPPAPRSPAPAPKAPGKAPLPAKPSGPVVERASGLREAADLLDKAQRALDGGNKNLAEMLFSSAELLAGAATVADLAQIFRAGAPPRVDTPVITVPDAGKQPQVVGSSDDEDAADGATKPQRGSLQGTLTVGGKAGGALAMVTLEPIGKRGRTRTPKTRVMEQRDRQFAPRLMIIPVGSTVGFPNYDSYFHNVFSTDAVARFDLGLYKQGQARQVSFGKEGIVRVGCNLHANMSATIVVVGQPHYVIPGADGSFAFKSLAPGKYRLRAWSEASAAPITQDVEVKAGRNTVTVGVAADGGKGPLPDKFGGTRGKRP